MLYMEIKYMKALAAEQSTNIGLFEEAIADLEAAYNDGKKFPLAFREYLLLAGHYDSTGVRNMHLEFERMQYIAARRLNIAGNKIERPFFVFSAIDGGSEFMFIYLDEDIDDPIMYNASPSYPEDGDELITQSEYTFSEWVNFRVDRAAEGY